MLRICCEVRGAYCSCPASEAIASRAFFKLGGIVFTYSPNAVKRTVYRANKARFRGFIYKNLPTPDIAEDGAGAVVPDVVIIEAVKYIRDNVEARRPVYVHCRWGANRSAIVVTAYLCAIKKIRLYEAIRTIKECHSASNPNYRQVAALRKSSGFRPGSGGGSWSGSPTSTVKRNAR